MATGHVRLVSDLHRRQEASTEPIVATPEITRVMPAHVQHLGYAVLLAPRGIVQDAPGSPADEHEVRVAAALDECSRVAMRRRGATGGGISAPRPPVRGDR